MRRTNLFAGLGLFVLAILLLAVPWNRRPPSGAETSSTKRDRVAAEAPGQGEVSPRLAGRQHAAESVGASPGSEPSATGSGRDPSSVGAAPTPSVRGRMLDPDGKPPENAEIYLVPKDPDLRGQGFEPVRADAGEDGSFCLDAVSLDDLWVVLRPSGGSGLLPEFVDGLDVKDGEPLDVTLELAPERTFRVTDLAGRPLAGARLNIIPPDVEKIVTWPGPGEPTMGAWSRPADENGTWTVRLPERGPVRVTAGSPGHVTVTRIVEPHEMTPALRLPTSAVIAITVEGAGPGLHVFAVAVRAVTDPRSPPGNPGSAISQDGCVEISTNLALGTYRVRVVAKDMKDVVLEDVVVEDFAQRVQRTVRLEPTAPTTGAIEVALPTRLERPGFHPLFAIVRPERAPHASWTVRPLRLRESRFVVLEGMPTGLHDMVLVNLEQDTVAVLRHALVTAGGTTKLAPLFGPATRRKMPKLDLGDDRVRGFALEADGLGDLPLYVARAGPFQLWPGEALPDEGAELGPFPVEAVTLRLELKDGTVRRYDLPYGASAETHE